MKLLLILILIAFVSCMSEQDKMKAAEDKAFKHLEELARQPSISKGEDTMVVWYSSNDTIERNPCLQHPKR